MKKFIVSILAITIFTITSSSQTVITTEATEVTYNSAKLNGSLETITGILTDAEFLYGIDTDYGSSISSPDFADNSFVQVSQTVTNLDFNTTYHYKLTAKEDAVLYQGSDITFTTANINQAENIVFSSLTNNSVKLTWINGEGDNRIVFAKESSAVDYDPIDGTTYASNPSFSTGTEYGTGNYVVANGTSNTVDITNLNTETTYHFKVFEYTGSDATSKFRTDGHTANSNPNDVTILKDAPSIQSYNLLATGIQSNSMNISWSIGNGENYLCVAYTNETYTLPVDGTDYSANPNFGNGDALGSGFVVYNGSNNNINITGLTGNTIYYFRVYDFNNSGTYALYNTSPATSNPYNATTLGDATWDGSANSEWYNTANWTPEAIPTSAQSVIIPIVTNHPEISGTREVENLTVEAGASLTIEDAASLTVSGNAIFKAPTGNGSTGQLVVYGDGDFSVSETTTFERYAANDKVFISSPTSGTSFLSFEGYLGDLFNEKSETTIGWEPLNNNSTLNTLEGWFIQRPSTDNGASRKFTINGDFNNGNISKSLSKTAASDDSFEGWHLLGNPYPSAIDVESSGFQLTNVDEVVYFYNNGVYEAYSITLNSGSATQYIPAMQGFWMRANTDGGTVTVQNSSRTDNTEDFRKSESITNLDPQIRLNIKNKDADNCEAVIDFREGYSNNFDEGKEAYFLKGDYFGIYTKSADNYNLCINAFALETFENENRPIYINIGVYVYIANRYTIEASEIENIDESRNVYLYDVYHDTYYDLRTESPEFELVSSVKSRFKLIITSESLNNLEYTFTPDINIYMNGNQLNINSESFINENGFIFVYDIMGRLIEKMAIDQKNNHTIYLAKQGSYIVQVITKNNTTSKKVMYNK